MLEIVCIKSTFFTGKEPVNTGIYINNKMNVNLVFLTEELNRSLDSFT